MGNGAFSDAVVFFRQALDWYASLSDSERQPEAELELLKSLETATFTISGYGDRETQQIYDRAWALCQQIGDAPEVFPELWGLWLTYHFSAETDKAVELGEKMMDLAQKEGDEERVLQAHHALWTTLTLVPDYERAHKHLQKGLALYRPDMHQTHCVHYGGHDPGMCGQRALCLTSWSTGFPDRAMAAGHRAMELSQAHHYSIITAEMALAFVHKQRGDLRETRDHAEAITRRASSHGFPGFVPWANILCGWVQGQEGQLEEGLAATVAACESLGYKESGYMSMLVELYLLAQQPDQGMEWIASLLELVKAKNEHHYEPELYRLQGELLAQQQASADRTVASFQMALDLSRGQGARAFELRAATSLVRFSRQQQPSPVAEQALATIYASFSEGLDTRDLRQARHLLVVS